MYSQIVFQMSQLNDSPPEGIIVLACNIYYINQNLFNELIFRFKKKYTYSIVFKFVCYIFYCLLCKFCIAMFNLFTG